MKVRRARPQCWLHNRDCVEGMRELPAQSVHCVVTSPPYWRLRDYQADGQHGLEQTFGQWLQQQRVVFAEIHRVLRDDGVLWINMGDSTVSGQLVGQPWRLVLSLRKLGFILRMDCVWQKPNPTPEPGSRKRPTTAHEYVFMMSKTSDYFYDRMGELEDSGAGVRSIWNIPTRRGYSEDGHAATFPVELPARCIALSTSEIGCCEVCGRLLDRKLRRLREPAGKYEWHAHEDDLGKGQRGPLVNIPLAELYECVGWRRTCEHRGFGVVPATVLDPYAGVATTGVAALSLGRSFVGFEVNPKYARAGRKNLAAARSRTGVVTQDDLQARVEAGAVGGLERLLIG